MRLALLFLMCTISCLAQEKPDAPAPKFYQDANFWIAESASAGQYLALARVTTANEHGIPANAPDRFPHTAAWNYGIGGVGIAVNTAATLLDRKLMAHENNRVWRFIGHYGAAMASGVILIPGTIHRAHTGRNDAPIF